MSDAAIGQAGAAGLPPGCETYRSAPVFTALTVPPALLRSHRTVPGTWALIRVHEGRLLYRVLDPHGERILDPAGAPGLVEPGVPHEVVPLGPVGFNVEFHRMSALAGPVAPVPRRPEGGLDERSQAAGSEPGVPQPSGSDHG